MFKRLHSLRWTSSQVVVSQQYRTLTSGLSSGGGRGRSCQPASSSSSDLLIGRVRSAAAAAAVHLVQVRQINDKPNYEWRDARRRKVFKVNLPDFEDARKASKRTHEETRSKMKEKGLAPPRVWQEKPLVVSATQGIIDEYVPSEGDGRESLLTLGGLKSRVATASGKKFRSYQAIRRIRQFEGDEFDVHTFPAEAVRIFVRAHEALMDRHYGYGHQLDQDRLLGLVTEHLYPEFIANATGKTIKWQLVAEIEPPAVVHSRTTDIIFKNNTFAQMTVRMHSRQILAIYDRHGRLMAGHPTVVKDVLEYCVFEKHLANEYGRWRLHGKIVPAWIRPRDPILKTFMRPVLEDPGEVDDPDKLVSNEELEEAKAAKSGTDSPPPPPSLATA